MGFGLKKAAPKVTPTAEVRTSIEMMEELLRGGEYMLSLTWDGHACEFVAIFGPRGKPTIRQYTGTTLEDCVRNLWGHERL